ncbi:MAG: hypothetical protein AB1Z98_02225 [Nannocystaceae bacterium]
MTTQTHARLKDLVVTATVASVVTAILGPMIRRWIDSGPSQTSFDMDDLDDEPSAVPEDATVQLEDDYEARVQRLFEFSPEAIPEGAVAMFNTRNSTPEET